jgi:hypothetical protein
VSFCDDHPSDPVLALPPEQAAYLRRVLVAHANDPSTAECPVCRVPSCRDWRDAYDRLAAAGQVMAEPQRWQSPEGEG